MTGLLIPLDRTPSTAYATPGSYNVSLTVTNAAGSDTKTEIALITVSEPAPVAQFSGEPLSGAVPLTVNFTDASTNAASYAWDFENDGTIDSTEQNPEHTYTAAGNYTVNLTVANSAASVSEVKDDYITVNPAAPVANFSANVTSGNVPLAVLFTDESTGDSITAWAWDFENDGIVDSSEQNPEHVYSLPGVYNVSLTVTSAGGSNTAIRGAVYQRNDHCPALRTFPQTRPAAMHRSLSGSLTTPPEPLSPMHGTSRTMVPLTAPNRTRSTPIQRLETTR